jgi:hypothetical protein
MKQRHNSKLGFSTKINKEMCVYGKVTEKGRLSFNLTAKIDDDITLITSTSFDGVFLPGG